MGRMRILKICVVGTNFISDRFCEAAHEVEGVEVSAVLSRRVETGRAFADKYGIKTVFTTLSDMLSSDIDAVYVASPTFVHKEQSVEAMLCGKAVLCEKMMGATFKDVEEMLDAKNRSGAVLLEAMRPDFDPAYKAVKDALPMIGRVRRAHLEFCQYSSRYDRFKSGEVLNAFDPTIANSALADIGIYPLHVCLSLFGAPLKHTSSHLFLENGFEALGKIELEYDGMLASVVYSKITDSTTPSVIEGELGSIIIDKISAPKDVTLKMRDGRCVKLDFDYLPNNMVYEIAAFRDAVQGKLDDSPYLECTALSVRIVDEIYRTSGISRFFDREKINI